MSTECRRRLSGRFDQRHSAFISSLFCQKENRLSERAASFAETCSNVLLTAPSSYSLRTLLLVNEKRNKQTSSWNYFPFFFPSVFHRVYVLFFNGSWWFHRCRLRCDRPRTSPLVFNLGFTGFYLVLLGFTWFWWVQVGSTQFYLG